MPSAEPPRGWRSPHAGRGAEPPRRPSPPRGAERGAGRNIPVRRGQRVGEKSRYPSVRKRAEKRRANPYSSLGGVWFPAATGFQPFRPSGAKTGVVYAGRSINRTRPIYVITHAKAAPNVCVCKHTRSNNSRRSSPVLFPTLFGGSDFEFRTFGTL